MKIRRFRVYAEREDLREMLQEFQNMFDIYYVPTYSDKGPACFRDAAALTDLGINFHGSHVGNKQVLVFLKTTECCWKEYRWSDNERAKMLYDGLKKIARRQSVKTVNGCFICKKAYENRERYRFCTIDIKSPKEYDMRLE